LGKQISPFILINYVVIFEHNHFEYIMDKIRSLNIYKKDVNKRKLLQIPPKLKGIKSAA